MGQDIKILLPNQRLFVPIFTRSYFIIGKRELTFADYL